MRRAQKRTWELCTLEDHEEEVEKLPTTSPEWGPLLTGRELPLSLPPLGLEELNPPPEEAREEWELLQTLGMREYLGLKSVTALKRRRSSPEDPQSGWPQMSCTPPCKPQSPPLVKPN